MKIARIEMENFRKHEHSVLELQDALFVCIRGMNHQGKSTIGQAVSMGLTLTANGLDPQGRNFTRKIKRGSEKAVVKLDIQAKHLIQQVVTLNTNTSGRTNRATCLDDEDFKPLPFENFLTRFKDALLVCTQTDYFMLRMDENRQKSLLAKLALPERYDFPEDKVEAVVKALGQGAIDFSLEPFAVIAKAYKMLYEERATVNRQLKDFVIPEPLGGPNVGSLPAMALGVDSRSLQKELADARAERQKIAAEKDAAVKAANEVEVKRATLTTKVEHLREKCREEKAKIENLTSSILSDDGLRALGNVSVKEATRDDLKKQYDDAIARAAELEKSLARFEELPDAGTTCPTCDQVVDPERLKKLSAESVVERKKLLEKAEKAKNEIDKLGDVDAAISTLAAHEKAVSEKAELSTALAKKVEEGKAAVAELNTLPAALDTAGGFTEPLQYIDAKITELTEQLSPVIAAEGRAEEIKTKTAAKKKLAEQAENLQALVEYFDKDGIKAKLLADHIGAFENKLNETLEAWNYKCSLSIEPFEFLVTNADGDTNLITELSDSEQLMFSVALQCAVSRVAGIGFIVADRMDTFLDEERVKANRVLYKLATDGSLDQVILIVTDKNEEAPKLKDAAFFMVKKGTVTRL